MPSTYFTISFTSIIYSQKDKPVNGLRATVEYFNSYENQWAPVVESKSNGLGIFKSNYTLPGHISKNDETTRSIKEIISSGGIPTFRLILIGENESENTFILSNFYSIKVDNEELQIDINFGKNWMLLKDKFLKLDKHTILITSHFLENDNELEKCKVQKEKLESEINGVKKNNQKLSLANEQLLREKEDKEKSLNKAEENLVRCSKKNEELESRIKTLSESYENQQKELDKCQSQDFKGLELKYKELELIHNECENQGKACQEKNEQLQKQLDEALSYNQSENPNKIDAKDVYTGIANELKEAQSALQGSNFKLGNIKLNLKALVNKSQTGGISYELLDKETAKGLPENAISTVEMDVIIEEPISSNESIGSLPNLIGYTETGVRKRLSNMGLKLNPVYSKEISDVPVGQSYKQRPDEGVEISRGDTITVFFSKQ